MRSLHTCFAFLGLHGVGCAGRTEHPKAGLRARECWIISPPSPQTACDGWPRSADDHRTIEKYRGEHAAWHRRTFARSPRAIALQAPSPTNRPRPLTVKAHAIAWSIRPPSASFRMPSAGLPFPLGTRIHPVRTARARPFATRVTATHVSSLASRTFAKNRACAARPAKQFRFLFSGGVLSKSSKTKRCAPEFLRRDMR